jgi:hypothetical protein
MSGPTNGNPALEAINRREMAIFERMVQADVALGVPAALHYCDEYKVPVPAWLTQSALALLCNLISREKSTRRGRSTASVKRYLQDMKDFARWNEVIVIREHQQTAASAGDEARAQWLGRSLARSFECVSEVMERTQAFGSADTVKRSYRLVSKNMQDEKIGWHPRRPWLSSEGQDLPLAKGETEATRPRILQVRLNWAHVSRETKREYCDHRSPALITALSKEVGSQ